MENITFKKARGITGRNYIYDIGLPEFSDKRSYDRHHTDIPSHAHTKEYKVRKSDVHIRRKRNIVINTWKESKDEIQENKLIRQYHRLSKGKVHCSCPMCQRKVKNLGWKHGDKVRLAKGHEL